MRHLDCACARIDLLDVRVPPWLCAGFLAGVLQGIGAFATESVQWRCTFWCVGSSACTLTAGEEPFFDREAPRRSVGAWKMKRMT